MAQTEAIDGRVTAVRGAVLDVVFEGTALPPIDDALIIMPDKGAPIVAEVQSHLNQTTVQAIALQSTAGLRRGVVAHPSGGPLEVPVGEAVLGRLLDLTGAVAIRASLSPLTYRAARFIAARRRLPHRAVRRSFSRPASRSSTC
jgi:F0F1-type ATP synthase beta subunit